MNDPNATEEQRKEAAEQLRAMGLKSPRRKISVRMRGWFGGRQGEGQGQGQGEANEKGHQGEPGLGVGPGQ